MYKKRRCEGSSESRRNLAVFSVINPSSKDRVTDNALELHSNAIPVACSERKRASDRWILSEFTDFVCYIALEKSQCRRSSRSGSSPAKGDALALVYACKILSYKGVERGVLMGEPKVYFGYRTALQILRTTNPDNRVIVRNAGCRLPERAPDKAELAAVLERLRSAHRRILVDSPVHVLVGEDSHRRLSSDCIEHVSSVTPVGKSFYRLGKGIYSAAPALALIHIAVREKSLVALQELVFELCGTYQTRRTGVASAYNVVPLASVRGLRCYIANNTALHGARKAARALRYVADGSASPRETKQALVLGLPFMYGGCGLGVPRMNYEVRASPAARAITGKSSFRCDLCWPEAKLDVEYQSRESHEGEAHRISDSRRTNALASMGWTVVCVSNDELDSVAATDTIADTIRRHLGKHARVRVSDYHARKLRLRRQLGLPARYE